MNYDKVQTQDDLKKMVCENLANNVSAENIDAMLADKQSSHLGFMAGSVKAESGALNRSSEDICDMARRINEELEVSKSDFANAVKLIRETRMAVNREINEMTKAMNQFALKREEAEKTAEALERLRDVLTDPVLKGVLK